MLWDASTINGYSVQASDGTLGHVRDILFEDHSGLVKWLVLDGAGGAQGSAPVSIAARIVGQPDMSFQRFTVDLTTRQVAELEQLDETPVGDTLHPLRSVSELIGYTVEATDGTIGHIENVLVEDSDRSIRYITVHTGSWWSGVKVMISPSTITKFDTIDRTIRLGIDAQTLRSAPVFDVADTAAGIHEAKFLSYFGIRWIAQ